MPKGRHLRRSVVRAQLTAGRSEPSRCTLGRVQRATAPPRNGSACSCKSRSSSCAICSTISAASWPEATRSEAVAHAPHVGRAGLDRALAGGRGGRRTRRREARRLRARPWSRRRGSGRWRAARRAWCRRTRRRRLPSPAATTGTPRRPLVAERHHDDDERKGDVDVRQAETHRHPGQRDRPPAPTQAAMRPTDSSRTGARCSGARRDGPSRSGLEGGVAAISTRS